MKSTFSVIFYLKRQAVKKDGTVPVMGRITVDGTQTQFSSKLSVDPKLWDTKGGRVTGRSSAALETNRLLDKMRVSINRHYQEIMERDNFVTAEKVKNAFLGLEHRCHTLMQVFRQHNEDYAKQVEAGMKAKATLSKYLVVYKHLQEFLNIRYHVKDIALKELTPAFISDFEMFLRTDKHCCTNTVWLYVCPLRTMRFEVNSGCRNIALNLESSTPIKKKYLLIWNQTDYLKVDDEDILWIKADGSYSCIHFKDGNKMMVSINLTNIMKDLPTEKFMRIHRSYIVNIGNIESIAGNCVRMNGQYIPVGREYRKDFFQRFSFVGFRKNT